MSSAFEELKGSIDQIGVNVNAFKKTYDERHATMATRFDDLEGRINEVEAARKMPGRHDRGRDIGLIQRMASNEALQAGLKNNAPTTVEIKASLREILVATKTPVMGDGFAGSPSSGFPVFQQRLDQIYNDPRRAVRILDVIPHQSVRDTNAIGYVQLDASYSPTAAVQATEGADKAEATVDTTLQTANLITIANYIPASTQVLSDVPSLQTYLTNLLRQAVLLKLESEVINGNSSAISGLTEGTTVATTTATSKADKLGEVKTQLEAAGWNPDVVVLNNDDWFAIQSERATGGDEQYVNGGGWANPVSGKVWGTMQPVASPVLAKGTAIIFDSSQTVIFDREVINLRLGFVGNQFTQNLVTLLVEGRFGFAILGPSAIRKLTI